MAASDVGVDGAIAGGGTRRPWVLLILVALVVAGTALILAASQDDSAGDVATGRLGGAVARWLPVHLPEGVELAWVDDHPDAPLPAPGPEEWTWDEPSAYDYGFAVSGTSLSDAAGKVESDGADLVEIHVAVYPGRSLAARAVASYLEKGFRSEGDGRRVEVRNDSAGQQSVTFDDVGGPLGVFELGDVVVRVAVAGLGATTPAVTFEELDGFVHSFRLVNPAVWRRGVEYADVAPPYGRRDPTVTLVEGEGWRLERFGYRPGGRVGTELADLIVDGHPSTPEEEMSHAQADLPALDFVQLELTDIAGGLIAWGLAPPDVATISFAVGDSSLEVSTLPFSSNRIFAIELSREPSSAATFDADGHELDHPTPLLPAIK